MRARPRGAEHRPAGAGRGRQGADGAAALPRAVPHPAGRARLSPSPPPPAATPATAPTSSPRPSASAARRFEILSGPREAKLSALGVVSGIHNPDGIVGDLGGGSLELIDVHGNRVRSGVTLPLGSLALQDLVAQIAEARRTHRQQRSVRRGPAQGRPAAAPSTRSAAPGARWRASTSSRAAIRCG